MSKDKHILLVYPGFSTFVEQDYKILSEKYRVDKYHFIQSKNIFIFFYQFLRQIFMLLIRGWKYDVFFIWFADYHSLLPVLFTKITGKKSFVVIGGYDVNYLPEFNYGSFSNPLRAFFTKKTFPNATLCLPVADALKKNLYKISPKAKAMTIPTSQNAEKFSFGNVEREKLIITLSLTDNYQRMMIKGLDRFREMAIMMSDFKFMIIGVTEGAIKYFEPIPENLILLPPVNHDELQQYLGKSSFYLQLSRSEGLPNALCEAMLCGCIPAGTNVGDIKTAIGPYGLTLDNWEPKKLFDFIHSNHENSLFRLSCRKHIIKIYDPSIRRNQLYKFIN